MISSCQQPEDPISESILSHHHAANPGPGVAENQNHHDDELQIKLKQGIIDNRVAEGEQTEGNDGEQSLDESETENDFAKVAETTDERIRLEKRDSESSIITSNVDENRENSVRDDSAAAITDEASSDGKPNQLLQPNLDHEQNEAESELAQIYEQNETETELVQIPEQNETDTKSTEIQEKNNPQNESTHIPDDNEAETRFAEIPKKTNSETESTQIPEQNATDTKSTQIHKKNHPETELIQIPDQNETETRFAEILEKNNVTSNSPCVQEHNGAEGESSDALASHSSQGIVLPKVQDQETKDPGNAHLVHNLNLPESISFIVGAHPVFTKGDDMSFRPGYDELSSPRPGYCDISSPRLAYDEQPFVSEHFEDETQTVICEGSLIGDNEVSDITTDVESMASSPGSMTDNLDREQRLHLAEASTEVFKALIEEPTTISEQEASRFVEKLAEQIQNQAPAPKLLDASLVASVEEHKGGYSSETDTFDIGKREQEESQFIDSEIGIDVTIDEIGHVKRIKIPGDNMEAIPSQTTESVQNVANIPTGLEVDAHPNSDHAQWPQSGKCPFENKPVVVKKKDARSVKRFFDWCSVI